jgi:SAM-dependent methyltransferase
MDDSARSRPLVGTVSPERGGAADVRLKEAVRRARDEALDYEYDLIERARPSGPEQIRLIDVGCGQYGLLSTRRDRLLSCREGSLGIDLDTPSLCANDGVRHRVAGSCYHLPLTDNSVDIVVARWLVEHLEHPEQALREFARVLRKGGIVYIKTPNLYNYGTILSRLTPTAFHNLLRNAAGQGENIPTYYRANTKAELRALAASAGLTVRNVECRPYSFMYYSFNRRLFVAMQHVSALVRRVSTDVQMMLLCVMEKA